MVIALNDSDTLSETSAAATILAGVPVTAEDLAPAIAVQLIDVLDDRVWAKHAAAASVTGRFTRPEEVADLVLLLASDRIANATGADFIIDGGLIGSL